LLGDLDVFCRICIPPSENLRVGRKHVKPGNALVAAEGAEAVAAVRCVGLGDVGAGYKVRSACFGTWEFC